MSTSIIQAMVNELAVKEAEQMVGELYWFMEEYRRKGKLEGDAGVVFGEMCDYLWKAWERSRWYGELQRAQIAALDFDGEYCQRLDSGSP